MPLNVGAQPSFRRRVWSASAQFPQEIIMSANSSINPALDEADKSADPARAAASKARA